MLSEGGWGIVWMMVPGSRDTRLGNWLMEGVGVWLVGLAVDGQLDLCLCARGCEGSLGFCMLWGVGVGVFDRRSDR